MSSYSFADFNASITGLGPEPNISFGSGAGVSADEGITVEPTQDDNIQTVGADGVVQNNKVAGSPAVITVRLLKTSPVNQQLSRMYTFQRAAGVRSDANIITMTQIISGETHTFEKVAFKKRPGFTFATDGGMTEWTFDCGKAVQFLGDYT